MNPDRDETDDVEDSWVQQAIHQSPVQYDPNYWSGGDSWWACGMLETWMAGDQS
jgi:hypothetical protein